MKTHTPGPWHSTCPPVCAARLRYIESGNYIIAEIVDPVKMSQSEGLANAALISAAPDLLEALENCLAMLQMPDIRFKICDGGRGNMGEQSWYMRETQLAKEAIRKAKGEA